MMGLISLAHSRAIYSPALWKTTWSFNFYVISICCKNFSYNFTLISTFCYCRDKFDPDDILESGLSQSWIPSENGPGKILNFYSFYILCTRGKQA